jgi:hypothetical protein
MHRVHRLALPLIFGAAACSAADTEGGVAAMAAYDVTANFGNKPVVEVLVFAADKFTIVMPNSPQSLTETDDRMHGEMWIPYTKTGVGTYNGNLSDFLFTATDDHGKLSGWFTMNGQKFAISGVPSKKRYTIAPPVDQQSLLRKASMLQEGHHAKEAIEVYQKIIEMDRFDTPHAGPALVGLVACLQSTKDDPAVLARGTELMSRYLSHPVALDGGGQLALDIAEEDLLWKPWADAAGDPGKPLIDIALADVQSSRQLRQGTIVVSTDIRIKSTIPKQMHLAQGDPRAGSSGCSAEATLPNGSACKATQCWAYATAFSGGGADLRFEGLPKDVRKLAKVTGTLSVTQEQEWELRRIPIKEGASWETPETTCTITRARIEDGRWSIMVVETAKPSDAKGAASARGLRSSGESLGSPYALMNARGDSLLPHSSSSSSDGTVTTTTLGLAAIDQPAVLVDRIATKVSRRDLAFTFTDVELP